MGAVNFSNAIYLSITDGKLSRRFKEPNENTATRTTKEGKLVHEQFFQAWKGLITNIEVKHYEFLGKKKRQWLITLTDEDGDAVLQMDYSSGYSSAFLKTLPNVDLSQEVVLVPKLTKEGDKKKATLFVNQNGGALKWYYTKDEPKGLPQMEQIKVKGELQWDDSKMMDFLEEMVHEQILPKLKATTPQPKTEAKSSAKAVAEPAGTLPSEWDPIDEEAF